MLGIRPTVYRGTSITNMVRTRDGFEDSNTLNISVALCLPRRSNVILILRDWSLITGRGGLQNGKIAGPKLFAPPPQDRVKLFAPPPFKEWKLNAPPHTIWLKLQATA